MRSCHLRAKKKSCQKSTLSALWSWTGSLKSCEKTNFCCWSHQSVASCYGSPRQTNVGRIWTPSSPPYPPLPIPHAAPSKEKVPLTSSPSTSMQQRGFCMQDSCFVVAWGTLGRGLGAGVDGATWGVFSLLSPPLSSISPPLKRLKEYLHNILKALKLVCGRAADWFYRKWSAIFSPWSSRSTHLRSRAEIFQYDLNLGCNEGIHMGKGNGLLLLHLIEHRQGTSKLSVPLVVAPMVRRHDGA